MRLADFSVDDNTRQSVSVSEAIANGPAETPMMLPNIPTNTGSVVGSPNSYTNGILMDDDEDDFLRSETDPFYIEDAIEVHKSNFNGKPKKPKKPSASIAKLPSSKQKPFVESTPEVFLDDNGNEYEYLGRFDGDLSFLDEKYKGVVTKAGDHLYRRATGVQFDGKMAEYEYFVGDDPESSAIFGKLFKGIGKAFKKFTPLGIVGGFGVKAASNLFRRKPKTAAQNRAIDGLTDHLYRKNTNVLGSSSNSTIQSLSSFVGTEIESGGEVYEYVGQSNGDLSFLSEIEPGVIIPPGAHIYRVQRTEGFDGFNEYDYYIGAHPEISNGLGSFFKKIGKGIGKAAKAVGKGVVNAAKWTGKTVAKGVKATGKGIGNAAKWTVNKALPLLIGGQQATADESNGVTNVPYDPLAGLNQGGGSYNDTDFGDGLYNDETGSSMGRTADASERNLDAPTPPEKPEQKNNLIIYAAIILAVLGLAVYLKNKK